MTLLDGTAISHNLAEFSTTIYIPASISIFTGSRDAWSMTLRSARGLTRARSVFNLRERKESRSPPMGISCFRLMAGRCVFNRRMYIRRRRQGSEQLLENSCNGQGIRSDLKLAFTTEAGRWL